MAERRREKIEQMRKDGIDPYPVDFAGRMPIGFVRSDRASTTVNNPVFAGRVTGKRDLGKIVFLDIEDQTGKIEVHLTDGLIDYTDNIALGDLVGVIGRYGRNRKNEIAILAKSFGLLAKAIRDPPDKVNGLKDDEYRYRHREVEMLANPTARKIFVLRSQIIQTIRQTLLNRGFIEVETPVLQPIYGGATARPFLTEFNALHKPAYLRISSELYLKRYLVGGMDKVFHVGKSFRNEGISTEHSPEFTMIEFFQTCVDYKFMERLTREVIEDVFDKAFGAESKQSAKLMNSVITDWDLPSIDWPLSRKKPKEPDKAEAWEMYLNGMEIASGASDLNDPDEQADRLREGSAVKVDNFNEANPYDQAYIESLEYGLMPIAGVGIGIDRLMMLVTGKKNIREVIAFPSMK